MRQVFECTAFLGLAVTFHVLLFAQSPPKGSEAGGVGGEALVTLAGATPQLAAMVETWERPPETEQQPDSLTPSAPVQSTPPEMPKTDLPLASAAPVHLQTAKDTAQTKLPVIDTTPPPPPAAVPNSAPRPQPRPKRTAPSSSASVTQAGRTAQRSAGTGGQQQAGQSVTASVSTLSPGEAAQLQAVWGAQIRSRIEREKRFPSGASGSGRVVVVITVAPSGSMLGYQIRSSSGSEAFDTSAMQAVARATRLPAAPPELTGPQYSFALPIVFSK